MLDDGFHVHGLRQGPAKPDEPDEREVTETIVTEDDEKYYCVVCSTLVTRARWRIAMNGIHEHTVFNPAGMVFDVLCFKEADGAIAVGEPTDTFTWFKGYDWRFAVCRNCGSHLGWHYEGSEKPAIFFALIKRALTTLSKDVQL